jgi:hypothetical protein
VSLASHLYQLDRERLRANVAAAQTHLKLLLALGDFALLGLLEGADRLDDLVLPVFDCEAGQQSGGQ